ncbi:MAG: hypothetical protein MMC33_005344 [Icmadophila ericetorum]|nr:hypothetical protein [Icmadophila ericetorum]
MYTSALLALLPLAAAQYGGGYGSGSSGSSTTVSVAPVPSSTTTASGATVHQVTVGSGGLLAFNPDSITAAVGDMVEFTFYPENHTVAQSSFAAPCVPLAGGLGLFSGFQFATASGEASNTFMIEVNTTSPVWLYCSQGKHCQAGMSLVINQAASGPNTIQAYQAASKNTTTEQPASIQGGVVASVASSTASGTASGSASSTSSAAVQSSTSSGASDTKKFGWAGFSLASFGALVFGGLLI